MSTPTGRRAGRHAGPGSAPGTPAAPRRPTSRYRAAVAGGAGLAVAVLVAFPLPAAAPGAAPARSAQPSPAALFPPTGARGPATLVPTAAAGLATTVAAPGTVGAWPAAYVVPSSTLTASGVPAAALDAYTRATAAAPAGCHLEWSLLAAIGRVESNHGRFGGATLRADGRSTPPVLGPVLDGTSSARIADTDGGRLDGNATYDRAVGPMQFIPGTWARYATDGDGDGVADPFDVDDAAAAAGRYLCAAGGNLSTTAGQVRAVLAYNHSDSYVATVLTLAAAYAGGRAPTLPTGPVHVPTIEPVNPAPPPALEDAPAPSQAPQQPTGGPTVLAGGPALVPTPADGGQPPVQTPDQQTPDGTQSGSTPAGTTPAQTAEGAPTGTSGATTSGTTTSGATTAGTTTPTTTSGTTTPTTTTPTTTTPTTTTPTTTTPTTTTPTTTTPTTTTPTTTTPTTTTSSGSGGTAGNCPVVPKVVLDVVNGTGNPTVAEDVTARLQAAGMTIGSVTADPTATTSALQYPAAARASAQQLATALGLPAADLQKAGVAHLTLVLAGTSAGQVQALVDRISCPA